MLIIRKKAIQPFMNTQTSFLYILLFEAIFSNLISEKNT